MKDNYTLMYGVFRKNYESFREFTFNELMR